MFAAEARRSGIKVLPPCVNASGNDFLAVPPTSEPRGAIRYALAGLKNIGSSAVASIIEARDVGGAFADAGDFARRLNPKSLNKRALETLAAGGAFDALEPNRALAHGNADTLMAIAQRTEANREDGMTDLFAGGGSASTTELKPVKAWTPMERLAAEFGAVGFYLSGHPLDSYASVLPKLDVTRYVDFEARTERGATAGRLAAIVVSARERRSQKGNKFAFAMFSDATGQFEAVIFSDQLAASRHLLEPGKAVLLGVEAERDGETVKLRVQSLQALDEAANKVQRGIKVVLDRHFLKGGTSRLEQLRAMLKPASESGTKGGGEVRMVLQLDGMLDISGGREIEFRIPGQYDVSPRQRGMLSTAPGVLEIIEL
jgi:DNA polymerase-3 subunit alpha